MADPVVNPGTGSVASVTAPARPPVGASVPGLFRRSRRAVAAAGAVLVVTATGGLGSRADAQGASAPASAQTTVVPPTARTTRPLRSDGAITEPLLLGAGSLRFTPPATSLRPSMGRSKARSIADRVVPTAASRGSADVFFALFSASSPAKRSPDGRVVPVFDQRPVWVVRYASVTSQRQSGIIIRRTGTTLRPTTTIALTVRTDIVVVIDDATATEVLRSEYAS